MDRESARETSVGGACAKHPVRINREFLRSCEDFAPRARGCTGSFFAGAGRGGPARWPAMKSLRPWMMVIVSLLAGVAWARAADAEFSSDLEAAKARAAKEGKQLVIEFSGRAWCPPCKDLLAEVLPSAEFATFASERVVVHLDYPRRSERTPEKIAASPELQKLQAYLDAYRIEGFPTVVLLQPDGTEVGRVLGYESGMGAAAFLAEFTAKK